MEEITITGEHEIEISLSDLVAYIEVKVGDKSEYISRYQAKQLGEWLIQQSK